MAAALQEAGSMTDRLLPSLRMVRRGALAPLAACAALGTACAQVSPPALPAPPEGKPMNAVTLQSITEAAVADAVRQTGLSVGQLRVTAAEPVTWRDGSLGCPQPGMAYTEALVPGFRIRVAAGDRELDYHASARGALVLCPTGRAVDPIPGGNI